MVYALVSFHFIPLLPFGTSSTTCFLIAEKRFKVNEIINGKSIRYLWRMSFSLT